MLHFQERMVQAPQSDGIIVLGVGLAVFVSYTSCESLFENFGKACWLGHSNSTSTLPIETCPEGYSCRRCITKTCREGEGQCFVSAIQVLCMYFLSFYKTSKDCHQKVFEVTVFGIFGSVFVSPSTCTFISGMLNWISVILCFLKFICMLWGSPRPVCFCRCS